jgi:hypothetical protein
MFTALDIGLKVEGVHNDSPLFAYLNAGDVVSSVNGTRVNSDNSHSCLQTILGSLQLKMLLASPLGQDVPIISGVSVLDIITPMVPLDSIEGFGSGALPAALSLDEAASVVQTRWRTSKRVHLRAQGHWKSGIQRSVLIQRMSSAKIPERSKIGVKPVGWMGQLAFALQQGLTALASSHHGSVEPKITLRVNQSVRITEYHPADFVDLRSNFRVSEIAFASSLGLQKGQNSSSFACIDRNQSSGKSSAFYFLSPCQHFFLKSLKQAEVAVLLEMLPRYTTHCRGTSSREHSSFTTMLPAFLGLFTIQLGTDKINVVAMVSRSVCFPSVHGLMFAFWAFPRKMFLHRRSALISGMISKGALSAGRHL